MTQKKAVKKSSKISKNSKSVHKSPQISKKTPRKVVKKDQKKFQPMAGITKKVITGGVLLCVVAVLMSLVINFYFEPSKVAERKLDELVKDYYENYYYDQYVVSSLENVKDGDYPRIKVKLRHLLMFDNGRNSSYKKYFDNTSYYCDSSESKVEFYPQAPYGKKDYETKVELVCIYR